jgi:hypothetical protein
MQTALMIASVNDRRDAVVELLNAGADVNIKNSSGWTALFGAASTGHSEVQEILIKHGADVNAKYWNGFTPLMFSVRHGPVQIVQLLIDSGADVNAVSESDNPIYADKCEGNTPLLEAIIFRKPEIVDLLLRKGADVYRANKYLQPPLYFAAVTGQEEMAKRLIREGAVVPPLENTSLNLFAMAQSHRFMAQHREEIGIPDSAMDHYLSAAGLFEKAKPLLLEESVGFRKRKEAADGAAGAAAVAQLTSGILVLAGAMTLREAALLAPEFRQGGNQDFGALVKRYAELSKECGLRSGECRVSANRLKR